MNADERGLNLRSSAFICGYNSFSVNRQTLIHTLIYGLCGGVLIVVLKLVEFKFLVVEHSMEIYAGLVAAIFAALGIWLGLKLKKKKEVLVVREVTVNPAQTLTIN
jgi:hypothetical protein